MLWEPAGQALLGSAMHLRAIARLAVDEPTTLLAVLRSDADALGQYALPGYGYRSMDFSARPQPLGGVAWWSAARAAGLHGWWGIALSGLLVTLLLARCAVLRDGGWIAFLGLVGGGAWLGALPQVVATALGDGPIDVVRHLYLANLLSDAALVLSTIGWVAAFGRGRAGVAARPRWPTTAVSQTSSR